MSEETQMGELDRMIDHLVNSTDDRYDDRRAAAADATVSAAATAPASGLAPGPFTGLASGSATDLALVARLHQLGPIEWPDDEVGDRITSAVAAHAARVSSTDHEREEATAASATPTRLLDRRPKRRPGPDCSPARRNRRWLVPSLAAAAVVVVAVLVVLSSTGTPLPGRSRSTPGRATTSPRVVTHLRMHLVSSVSSPFQAKGSGPQTGSLECVTALVCYASDTQGSITSGSGVERTADGGATWQQTAALPDGAQLSNQSSLSCPTVDACAGAASVPAGTGTSSASALLVAFTDDAGAHWNLETLAPTPGISAASVVQVACTSARACIVQVAGTAAGSGSPAATFELTTDGGASWTLAAGVPPGAAVALWTLRCDPSGECVGLALSGSGNAQQPASEGIVAVQSTDAGRTWTATTSPLAIGPGTLLMSCGDARHCMAAYNNPAAAPGGRASMVLAITANAGASWQVFQPPTSWPDVAISISCATGEDCYVSAANATTSGYSNPVIEATHDGGAAWEPLGLAAVDGAPLALVYPLSCPTARACVGVGATAQQFGPAPSGPPKSPPPADGERVIISNATSSRGS